MRTYAKRLLAAGTAFFLTTTAIVSLYSPNVKADELKETIAEFKYVYDGGFDASGNLLSEDFSSELGGKNKGYSFTGGTLKDSACLRGSVNGMDPSTTMIDDDETTTDIDEEVTPFRKMGWSKPEYKSDDNDLETNVVPILAAKDEEGKRWGETPYFLIKLSTTGYESISFFTQLSATKKGPKDFKLQYSTTGTAFQDFKDIDEAVFSIEKNKNMKTAFQLALPETCSNADTLYILIIATSQTTVGGTTLSENPAGGEIAINNIQISGLKKDNSALPSSTPVQTSTPIPSPSAIPTSITTVSPSPASQEVKVQTVKKVKLNKKKVTLKKGKSIKLKATYSPAGAKTKLTWKSSKKKVARVNKNGIVKAVKKGKAVITVKSSNDKKAACKITVK